MASSIGSQDGIEATRINLNKLDPGKASYDKLAATLTTLKLGHNEVHRQGGIADRVKALEEAMPPFPLAHKGVFISWALFAGGRTFPGGEPHTVAQKLREHNFGWAAVHKRWENDLLIADFVVACEANNILHGVWEDSPRPGTPDLAVRDYQAQFYIGQVEGPMPELEDIADTKPDVPSAIVTNAGGFCDEEGKYDPTKSQALRENGWSCLIETYLPENPNLAPNPVAKMDYVAKRIGWEHSQPVIGCYWDVPASSYDNLSDHPGFCVWLAESMVEADWEYLGAL